MRRRNLNRSIKKVQGPLRPNILSVFRALAYRSLITVHRSLITVYRSLITVYRSLITVHRSLVCRLLFTVCCLLFTVHCLPLTVAAGTELGAADDLTVLGIDGTVDDPDVEIKGFTIFGSTNVLTHISTAAGNTVFNGAVEVSSDIYIVGKSTFIDNAYFAVAESIFINDGSANQMLQKNAAGYLEWINGSSLGDDLGNHVATTTLNMAGFQINNVSTITINNGTGGIALLPYINPALTYAGDNGIAIGSNTYNNYDYGVGVGDNASNNNTKGVGIGYQAFDNYNNGVGVGARAYNNYTYGVGVGYKANNNNTYGVGVGYGANTNQTYGVGVGVSAYNNRDYGVGVGNFAAFNDDYGVGVGAYAQNNDDYAVGIGAYSQYNQTYGTGLGAYTTAASSSVALGSYAKANAKESLALGAGTVNNSTGTANFGVYAIETSSNVTAVKFYGDGSELTGISGDDLGNHVATTTLNMATYDIDVSTINAKDANGLFLLDDGGNGIFVEDGGNIGIGTIEPVTSYRMNIVGSNGLQIDTFSGYVHLRLNNPANSHMVDIANYNDHLNLATLYGNTGVGGWFSPGSKLSVWGNFAVGTGYATITAPLNGMIIEGKVGIGTASPATKLHMSSGTLTIDGNVATSINANGDITAARYQINGSTVVAILPGSSLGVGINAGRVNTTGAANSFFGAEAGYANTSGYNNSFLGYRAGYANITGHDNVFVGSEAGSDNTTGNGNSFMGPYAGYFNTTGNENAFLGYDAGRFNQTGSANAILGNYAGYGVVNNSFSSSTLMGYHAGYGLTTGSGNLLLGFQSGDNLTTGSRNIIIGYDKNAPTAVTDDHLNIGGVIYGDLSAGNVGIGIAAPTAKLHVQAYEAGKYTLQVSTSSTAGNYSIAVSSTGMAHINNLIIDNRESDPAGPLTGQIWMYVGE